MRLSTAIIPVLIMGCVGVGLGIGLRNDPRTLPSMMIDRALPDFDLPALHAGESRLKRADVEGKVALINIFASWCVSCRIEHPTLMALAASDRVPIFGVDWKDKPEDGAAWLEAFGDPYDGVGVDENSRLAIELGVTGAPETYIVDKTGRIRFKQIGPITDDVWRKSFAPLIETLENERAP